VFLPHNVRQGLLHTLGEILLGGLGEISVDGGGLVLQNQMVCDTWSQFEPRGVRRLVGDNLGSHDKFEDR
jgi:hypothetical protein